MKKIKNNKVKVCVTNTYAKLQSLIDGGCNAVVMQGGSYSGKTVAAFQKIINHVLANSASIDRDILCIFPNSCIAMDKLRYDFKKVMDMYGLWRSKDMSLSSLTYTMNGVKIIFMGMDNLQCINRMIGPRTEICFIDNMDDIYNFSAAYQARIRTKLFIAAFNPSCSEDHFIYDWISRCIVKAFISSFKDNALIPDVCKSHLLSLQPTKENIERGTASKYLWTVYGEGKSLW